MADTAGKLTCFPDVWAPEELSIFTSVVSVVIALVALFGNGLIIFVVVKDPIKKLHTPFNYFLVNLAVADLIIGCVVMPLSAYVHYKESTGFLNSDEAKAIHMTTLISGTASLLSLLALSIDRYIAISWAIKYRQYLSWDRCKVVSLCIWLFSLSFPFVYFEFGYINYLMLFACSAILTGLVVMLFIYAKIYLFLRNQTSEMKTTLRLSSTAAQEFHLKRLLMEKKVTRVFLVIITVFVLTYVPAAIMIFILHFCETCDCSVRHVLRDLQFLLMATNSFMNPFICTIRLKHFRQSIGKLFTSKRRQGDVINTSSSSSNRTMKQLQNQSGGNTIKNENAK